MDIPNSDVSATVSILDGGSQLDALAKDQSGVSEFFDSSIEKLKEYENTMRDKFIDVADPDSFQRRMPDYILEEFKRLEDGARTNAERAIVEEFKAGITAGFEANQKFFEDKIQSKLDNFQMNLGAQYVSKSVKGIQQLLSSQ